MRSSVAGAFLKFSIFYILFAFACHRVVDANFPRAHFIQPNNQTKFHYNDHNFKVIENLLKIAFEKNLGLLRDEEGGNSLPTNSLDGVYPQCVLAFSFPCLQRKIIIFLHKLDQMKRIHLLGKSVLLVRKENAAADPGLLARISVDEENLDQDYLKDIIDNQVDKFFDSHSLRLRVPQYFEDSSNTEDEGAYLDIDFDTQPSTRQGRKKKYGKIKGLKKLMMVIGLMTCMKLTLMGPLMIGLLGLKAMKALLFAVMSLTISKLMMLSKVNFHSLLGSHDWSGGGSSYGGGWDRITHETTLAPNHSYDMEPPAPFSTYTIKEKYN